MKAIGGYFGLELPKRKHYHENMIMLNTARNALGYLLQCRSYEKIYLPYYMCDTVLEPVKTNNMAYEFYHIDENFEPEFDKTLSKEDVFLYINYFGIKQDTVKKLQRKYTNLIIDNSQSFFAPQIGDTDTFYSPRKFFGVPDGAYLATDCRLNMKLNKDISHERMGHLLKRIDISPEEGYVDFKANSNNLRHQPIRQMSSLTQAILLSIDYKDVVKKRINNYHCLDNLLGSTNKFKNKLGTDDVPMVYPYWPEFGGDLKQKLIANKIYIATYWPNVLDWCNEDDFEYQLANHVLFLPIDQRLDTIDMLRISALIKQDYRDRSH